MLGLDETEGKAMRRTGGATMWVFDLPILGSETHQEVDLAGIWLAKRFSVRLTELSAGILEHLARADFEPYQTCSAAVVIGRPTRSGRVGLRCRQHTLE